LKQNDFYNAVMVLKTDLSPFELLRTLQYYEYRFKRIRSFKDAPRTLDLDIIFFNRLKLNKKDLNVYNTILLIIEDKIYLKKYSNFEDAENFYNLIKKLFNL